MHTFILYIQRNLVHFNTSKDRKSVDRKQGWNYSYTGHIQYSWSWSTILFDITTQCHYQQPPVSQSEQCQCFNKSSTSFSIFNIVSRSIMTFFSPDMVDHVQRKSQINVVVMITAVLYLHVCFLIVNKSWDMLDLADSVEVCVCIRYIFHHYKQWSRSNVVLEKTVVYKQKVVTLVSAVKVNYINWFLLPFSLINALKCSELRWLII